MPRSAASGAALLLCMLAALASCSPSPSASVRDLHITDVGRYDFVGGDNDDPSQVAEELSGLERLSGNTYLAVSDEHACLHVLTIEVDAESGAITNVEFVNQIPLLDADGRSLEGSPHIADREGVALDSAAHSVWISHERSDSTKEFSHSIICEHSLDTGLLMREVDPALDPALKVFAHGRYNRGLESLAGRPDGSEYWTANEETLPADGALPTTERGALVRLQRFNAQFAPREQYVYEGQPVSGPITSPAALARDGMGGVVDLEVLPDGTLLALERSFAGDADGFAGNTIGVYQVDVSQATDVSGIAALTGIRYRAVAKKPLIELYFPLSNSNYEGITLGPRLANGDYSLILIADNNSGPFQSLYALRLGVVE